MVILLLDETSSWNQVLRNVRAQVRLLCQGTESTPFENIVITTDDGYKKLFMKSQQKDSLLERLGHYFKGLEIIELLWV